MEFETIFNTTEKAKTEKPKAYAPDNVSVKKVRKKSAPIYVDKAFRSNDMNWVLFTLILAFNAFVFSAVFDNCVTAITKDIKAIISALYGIGVSILIAKILFHQDWKKANLLSPALICLYVNAIFAGFALTMDTANIIQKNVVAYLLVCIPIAGLLVLVVIMNNED